MFKSFSLIFAAWAFASLPVYTEASCKGLIQELNSMKEAQNQIITSLARNHDLFADQLSEITFELALYKKSVPPKALESMEKSSQAYRSRAQKAFRTAESLEDSTEQLISRLQRCLK